MTDKPILINEFYKETGESSYVGFEEMRCLDPLKKPGIVKPSYSLVKESASVVDDEIFMTVTDDSGNLYGITKENTNSVFKRTQAGTWTELSGFANSGIYGIAFWQGYIILIHSNGNLDASADDGATWTNGFDTFTAVSASTNPSIVAQDGILYIADKYNVWALDVGSSGGFDPTGSSGTDWSLYQTDLSLSTNYEIVSVVALGNLLLFGTVNSDNENDATIFPWDRTSPSFNQPIRLKENGITYMVEVENLVYVMAGNKGRWYLTNGSTARFLSEIPKTLFNLENINIQPFRQAVAYNEGLIYFGVSYNNAITKGKLGVYSLNPRTGKINFAHIISPDETGLNNGVYILSITKVTRLVSGIGKESIVVTWFDINGTAYGADAITNVRYTDDRAFFVSQFYPVGTKAKTRSFARPEFRLSKPIASGDSFKVYTRTTQNGSWTLHYSEDRVGIQNGQMPPITNVENIQLKVVLNNDIELYNITLI